MAFRADFWLRLPILFLVLLAGCSWMEPRVVELPDEIGKTSSAFVTALQKGDRAEAERAVAPTALDELDTQFTKQHKQLKNKSKLTPRFVTYKPREMMGPFDSEVTVVYAARDGGQWTTAEVRLFRLNDEPYEVDYWKIGSAAPVAKTYAPDLKPLYGVFIWLAAAIFMIGTVTIVVVLWIVKRKPHIVVPEPVVERRAAAIATREPDTEE
jgi:hypothetical protein